MVVFKFKDGEFYMDGRLKEQLDKKVFPDLQKKDKDAVLIVDGEERSGKSVFAMILGACASQYFKKGFDLSNVCMNPLEFRQKIEKAEKNQVVIFDEAYRGMASSRTLSEINNILKDLMMEMGQLNLLVIIVLPTFFLLDKYAALFRATGLFHIYENKRRRGFWVYFNKKNKKKLYMRGKKEFDYNCMRYPYFRGRFYNQYPLNEKEYREKKKKSFKIRPRLTKAEKYMEQRDILIYNLRKELRLSLKGFSIWLKEREIVLSHQAIADVEHKITEKQVKSSSQVSKLVYNTLI